MQQDNTPEQLRTIDEQARLLLSDPKLGPLIRQACGAARCGRRERGRSLHALDAMVGVAFAEPVLAEILARAIAIAWREHLDWMLGGTLSNARLHAAAFHTDPRKTTPDDGGRR